MGHLCQTLRQLLPTCQELDLFLTLSFELQQNGSVRNRILRETQMGPTDCRWQVFLEQQGECVVEGNALLRRREWLFELHISSKY